MGPDFLYPTLLATGQHKDFLIHFYNTTGDLAGKTAKIMKGFIGRIIWAIHPLHGETKPV